MLSFNCKHVQHVKIYLPCNFEINPITHFGVIALFSSNFQNVNTFRPLIQKLYEIDVKFKMQKCAAFYLPTLQFLTKFQYPFWSYFPFSSNFLNFNSFRPLFQKLSEIDVKL